MDMKSYYIEQYNDFLSKAKIHYNAEKEMVNSAQDFIKTIIEYNKSLISDIEQNILVISNNFSDNAYRNKRVYERVEDMRIDAFGDVRVITEYGDYALSTLFDYELHSIINRLNILLKKQLKKQ